MVETIIQLKPHSAWPEGEKYEELVAKLNQRLQLPGWTNAWTMPIKTRVDMLTTGVRTPVGIKVFGQDLAGIDKAGQQLERVLQGVPGTRSALYERSLGGTYVDVVPKREALARYGLQIDDINAVVESAIGGEPVTTTIEGRQRFTVNLRYKEDFRDTPEKLRDVLVTLRAGSGISPATHAVPLGELADLKVVEGPPMLRDEAGLLVGYVYVDIDPSHDLGGYVESAKAVVATAQSRGNVTLGAGMYLKWTGEYEMMEGMRDRMKILIPLALAIVTLLLYLQFKHITEVLIVLLSIPFALVGSVWLIYLLHYRISAAVLVGLIALVGLAAQTGVVMIVYIDHAFLRRLRAGKIRDLNDIIHAHTEGTVQRVRPKLMTVGTMLIGLVPLLWATGSGADVMKRIAAPMVGGLLSSAFLTLELIPVVYTYWRYSQLKRAQRTGRPIAEVCGNERESTDQVCDMV
jgi:Cu(I)/Ag(I) efflux system membrane protein CusA/SilA